MNKVLITGSSGMVGKNLIQDPGSKNYNILNPTSLELDLTDYKSLVCYLRKAKPDLIIHAAGKVGGIQANISDQVGFLDSNLLIGRNLIIGALETGVQNLINLGSTCMYPKNGKNPLYENLILTGELEPTNEGYALAKVITTKLCEYIMRQHSSLNYKTVIPCNLYGPFDKFSPKHSHLIPAIIHKIHMAKVESQRYVEIWGDGTARREFMYVGDLANALWKAVADIGSMPNVFNCGLGYDYTITEYYCEVANVIGWNGEFIHNLDKPVGMNRKLSDISRQKNWGWSPYTSLSEGIMKTYSYYLSRKKNEI